jgi:predicted GTPase
MDIAALRKFEGRKVVVLGKGGLGKSSTINALTKNSSNFAVGTGSDDVTKDIQCYVDEKRHICFIDTPGKK